MAFEGTLETFSIADILQLIGLQRKTGILTLKSKEEVVTVSFYNGMIVTADSVPKKLEDKLGKVLVKTSMIQAEQLEEALNIQKKTLQKLGYILVKQGYLSQEQLKDALQVQVSQMIYRLFRWTSGEYYFDPKAKVDFDPENMVPMSAESILMEGIQMIDEWPLIQKKIPSFNIIFRKTANVNIEPDKKDEFQEVSSEFDMLVEESIKEVFVEDKLKLNREEEKVYNLVDGQRTVQQIIDRCPLTEFHTCKALFELHTRNIIEVFQEMKLEYEKKEVTEARIKDKEGPSYILGIIFLVIGVASLIFNLFSPFGYFFNQPLNFRHVASRGDSWQQLIKIKDAVVIYNSFYRRVPLSLDEVLQAGLLINDDLYDPWGRPYEYQPSEEYFIIKGTDANGNSSEELVLREYLSFVPMSERPVLFPKESENSTIEIAP
ncbi:MAG: hypothetical protein A2Y62_03215 [Candidatus Fischerbacteria bacterium RBG_13_37_8]|uniref:PatA-like N-terminal domain-containing protein n=1 Tax=Candidatus Fischerbacteria bacterium RBG_13_37_8 TaxID=1817863 RepID=A0A1F5VVV0_9BACT|nr:MAG: hypothetical protein A2Y62_03215 [Candidatus Fischerbacteria bacterium RBG_13_37_8]